MLLRRSGLYCLALLCLGQLLARPLDAQEKTAINVMSWNVRYNNPRDGLNRWRHRKDWVAEIIAREKTDIAGLQEVLHNQLGDLKKRLPKWSVYGVGRDDGKARGEYAPIFYRVSRFKKLAASTFWLSRTPDKVASRDWDAAITRIASWVKLKDRRTGKIFYVINTHFDHRGRVARRESAALIASKMRREFKDHPVVLTGDFNTKPDAAPYKKLIQSGDGRSFFDSRRRSVTKPAGPNSTWNGFRKIQPGLRIDYIFVTRSIQVNRHLTLTDQKVGRFPSDHLPVITRIQLAQ